MNTSASQIDFLSIEESIHFAISLLHIGKPTDSVLVIIELFRQFNNDQLKHKEKIAADLEDWPDLGVKLDLDCKNSINFVIEPKEFSRSIAKAYIHYVTNYISRNSPPDIKIFGSGLRHHRKLKSFQNFLLNYFFTPIVDFVFTKLSPRLSEYGKWRLVCSANCVRNILLYGKNQNSHDLQIIQSVSGILNEPVSTCRKIFNENRSFSVYKKLARLQLFDRLSTNSSKAMDLKWSDKEQFKSSIGRVPNSKIIAGMHMGLPVNSQLLVAEQLTDCRKIISLVQFEQSLEWQEVLYSAYAKLGIEFREYGRAQLESLSIVADLRRNKSDLFVYFDLSASHGEATTVQFFGRAAQFPKGVAQISLSSRIPIYPLMNYWDKGKVNIEILDPIYPVRQSGESLEEATQRITQQLVSLAESYIRRFPEQWQFLKALPAYFTGVDPNENQKAVSANE